MRPKPAGVLICRHHTDILKDLNPFCARKVSEKHAMGVVDYEKQKSLRICSPTATQMSVQQGTSER
ncbi:hypothetical protein GDO81_013152 [Engystomops pustulosus]|uniref:Uncharacterized protein n=1 Tax=Engystomops pustulosus TaxID=76066 RepID=A0AAV7B1T8_ENGPU|nr:hypothetical protein GDO81_013152 [Engystomops pustulosus]